MMRHAKSKIINFYQKPRSTELITLLLKIQVQLIDHFKYFAFWKISSGNKNLPTKIEFDDFSEKINLISTPNPSPNTSAARVSLLCEILCLCTQSTSRLGFYDTPPKSVGITVFVRNRYRQHYVKWHSNAITISVNASISIRTSSKLFRAEFENNEI